MDREGKEADVEATQQAMAARAWRAIGATDATDPNASAVPMLCRSDRGYFVDFGLACSSKLCSSSISPGLIK